jgi:hypothetical protein
MDAAKIGGEKAGLSGATQIPRWNVGQSAYISVRSNGFFISGKTKVHITFGREGALPHFGESSETSPGPSEMPPLGKRIHDSGH